MLLILHVQQYSGDQDIAIWQVCHVADKALIRATLVHVYERQTPGSVTRVIFHTRHGRKRGQTT